MIPHKQTRLHIPGEQFGDCWPTAIESVLDLPLGTIPRWEQGQAWGDYWYQVQAYLYHHHRLVISKVGSHQVPALAVRGWHLLSGRSPRMPDDPHFKHAVVAKDGVVVHDPHPDGTGVLDVQEWEVITPVPAGWEEWWHPASLPCPCGDCPAIKREEAA